MLHLIYVLRKEITINIIFSIKQMFKSQRQIIRILI